MDFWSRWQCRQTWLISLHNHNKITTKILLWLVWLSGWSTGL